MNEWTGVIAAATVLLAAVGIFVATRQLRLQRRTLAHDDADEVLRECHVITYPIV